MFKSVGVSDGGTSDGVNVAFDVGILEKIYMDGLAEPSCASEGVFVGDDEGVLILNDIPLQELQQFVLIVAFTQYLSFRCSEFVWWLNQVHGCTFPLNKTNVNV